MEFNYDFANTPPSSGGGKNFPVSPEGGWLCQIVGEEMRPMKTGQGQQLVFMLQGLEGAVNGMTAESRHNVQHVKPETSQIAMAEISAIAYATGTISPGNTRLQRTTDMFNKPFRVIVVQQPANPQYTDIIGFRTADGRDPVKIANGSANVPTHGAPGGQPAGMPPGGAPQFGAPAFGQQPQGQPQGGFAQQAGQPQPGGFGQPQQGQQGGFQGQPQQNGAPAFGQQPQGQPQGQPAFGQPQGQQPPAGGGWGQPAVGQPQGAPQGQPQWGGQQGQPQWGQQG